LILFQTKFGVLSGPAGEKGEEKAKALVVSYASSLFVSLKGRRTVGELLVGIPRKKCGSGASFTCRGVVAPVIPETMKVADRSRTSGQSTPSGGWQRRERSTGGPFSPF